MLENRQELLDRLLKLLKPSNRYKRVAKMLEDVSSRFSTAPASSRVIFHNCYEGGLLDHSIIVVLKILTDFKFYQEPLYSIILAGLFHDLGKIGNKKEPYYAPAEQWQYTRGTHYNISDNMKRIPHSARSIYILNQYHISLTEPEFQAIMYHNLLPEDSGLIKWHETPLLMMLHQADMWSCAVYEKTYLQDKDILQSLIDNLDQIEKITKKDE